MARFDFLTEKQQHTAMELLDTPAGAPARAYAGSGDARFAAWRATGDRLCDSRHDGSIFDLSEFLWRDHHDAGDSPDQPLSAAIEYAGEA